MNKVILLVCLLMAGMSVSAADGADLSKFKKDRNGWIRLFDGKSFTGWRGYNKTGVPAMWEVKNGTLHIKGNDNKPSKEDGGDLIFDHKFKNFEFEMEWKVDKGANSGLFYLAQEVPGKPIYASCPECQILDNQNHRDALQGKDGNHQSASLYDMIPAKPQNAKPFGKWNKIRIVFKDGNVEHYQNDVLVVHYTMWGDQWKSLLENSKFKKMKGAYDLLLNCGGENREGFIGLQDHGGSAWFRNIRIRLL